MGEAPWTPPQPSGSPPAREVLGSGDRQPRGVALRAWLGDRLTGPTSALLVGAALLGLGAAGDWLMRNWEMAQLVAVAEQAQADTAGFQVQRERLITALIAADARGLTKRDYVIARERFYSLGIDSAESARAAAADLMAVDVLPWHGDIEQARRRYLQVMGAREAYWSRGVGSPFELAAGDPYVFRPRAARRAELAYREALPPLALADLEARVEALFGPRP